MKRRVISFINAYRVRGKQKIFCVGRNKTGTTSLKRAFIDLGFIVGDQKRASVLLPEYLKGNFKPIVDYCRSAQVFQDVPFSYPNTYRILDKAYPNSRFILSIRDPDEWFDSLLRYYSQKYALNDKLCWQDLENAQYISKGWMSLAYKAQYGDPYIEGFFDRSRFIELYNRHNQEVCAHFAGRNNLLVVNVSEPGAYEKFCEFIQVKSVMKSFPWENKSR